MLLPVRARRHLTASCPSSHGVQIVGNVRNRKEALIEERPRAGRTSDNGCDKHRIEIAPRQRRYQQAGNIDYTHRGPLILAQEHEQ